MKKLIIIGAGNFQLPLIKKAGSMGIETHVFSWVKDARAKPFCDYFYPVSVIEKEIILRKARQIKPDGIISIASDLAIITVNYLAEVLGLVGNSRECTKHTTNKLLMRQRLDAAGLAVPAYRLVGKNSGKMQLDLNFPLIVKPVDRSGSRGVCLVERPEMLDHAVSNAISHSFCGEAIVEEYIEGDEYSLEMISWKGNHIPVQLTEKKTTGPPWFIESAHYQPASVPENQKQKIIKLIRDSLSVLGLQYGASHSEVIITKDGKIYIIEIAGRLGGDYIGSDLIPLSTGFDILNELIEMSMGSFTGISINSHDDCGIKFIVPEPGKVIEIIDRTAEYADICRSEIYICPGDHIPSVRESSQRPACFIYRGSEIKSIPVDEIIEIVTSR